MVMHILSWKQQYEIDKYMVKMGMVGGKFGMISKHITGNILMNIRAGFGSWRHVTCWTSPLYHKLWGCFDRITVGIAEFFFCRLLKL